MRFLLALSLSVLALVFGLSCNGDSSDKETATPPTATASEPANTATPTLPQRQPTVTPEPTEEPSAKLTLVPVDRDMPLEQTGSYLMDMDTFQLWYTGRGGVLSPDGSALAADYCCLGDGRGVDILEVPSGAVTTVPVPGDLTSVVWAPDSQQLALIAVMPTVTQPDSERALYLINRDGSGLRKVATIDAERPWLDVRWLDQETILAVHDSLDDLDNMIRTYFRVDVSTGAVVELAPSDPPTPQDPRILTGERSPEGRRVAYEDHGLYVWDTVNGGEAVLVDAQGYAGQWSFDGTRLLFVTVEDGRQSGWHVFNVGTGAVTDFPEVGLWAYWLADGRIVHSGFRCGADGPWDIATVDSGTGNVEVLTRTPDAVEYEGLVSPAGDRLVYFNGDTPRTLELIVFSSGARKTLVTGSGSAEPFDVYPGAWSADGHYLQFGYGGRHGICD
jgi:hypothetical protein